jgi:hypothetical protein
VSGNGAQEIGPTVTKNSFAVAFNPNADSD